MVIISAAMVVQTIDIDCSVAKVFDFMSDAPQWLPWAMPELETVQPLPFGQWLLKTPRGLSKLRPWLCLTRNGLDYELIKPGAGSWWVPMRMQATPTGTHLTITFVKPEGLADSSFEAGMHHASTGLHTLKLLLEQA